MIGTIRKHSKILWAVIITVVIITFVFWTGQSTPGDRNARGDHFGRIGGEEIKKQDFIDAYREVNLLYFFSAGDWPKESAKQMGFDVDRETYIRLLMLKKVKEAGIHISDETVARTASEFLRSLNKGEPVPLDAFEKNTLARGGMTLLDFQRYVRDMLAIHELMSIHGMAGQLVTPEEMHALYERENQQLATEAVFFSATNHLSEIHSTPEALSGFYSNQMARYRIPDRVQVAYVAFEITNFTTQAEAELMKTNFNEMVDMNVQALGTNYFKEAKTPEENRIKVREELIKRKANMIARQRANDFARAADNETNKTVATFEKLAAQNNLAVKVTAPFDQEDGPKEFTATAGFTRDAFNRTADEPFSAPLDGQDAVYVIALERRVPSEIPALDLIHDRVQADYKLFQAAATARRNGTMFATLLTNGLASGKTFAALCAESQVKPVTIPPLSLVERSVPAIEQHVTLQQYKNTAFTTTVGKASPFVPTMDGGYVVYVREKIPLDVAAMNAELPEFSGKVRQTRQSEAFNEWFRREADRNLRETPVFSKQQPPAGQPTGN